MLIPLIVIESSTFDVFTVEASQEQIDRMDDEENYVIINPLTKQCFINNQWVNIPQGRIQADGQIEVHNAG